MKPKYFQIFEYTNTSGESFTISFNSKEEKEKAWKKMFKYYNSNKRMHPLYEYLDLSNQDMMDAYTKAKKGNVTSIKHLLNHMWDTGGLFSFYGRIIKTKL